MLLGEPSPSLAKINTMNMAKLTEKIAQLTRDRGPLVAKLEKLQAKEDPPASPEEIKRTELLIARLDALKQAAQERLDGKAERKALREAGKL